MFSISSILVELGDLTNISIQTYDFDDHARPAPAMPRPQTRIPEGGVWGRD